jgi:hypothetical protein
VNTTNDIYKNIVFHQNLTNQSNTFIRNNGIDDSININIVHLRLEKDAIQHWSLQNGMNEEEFKTKLTQKYIHLINNLINKEDKTILLTYCKENQVINYLKTNHYQFYIQEKERNNNREINAIIDLLNSKHCNNVFIAVGGSTFSWTVMKMTNPKKIEWFDINNL